MVPAQFFAAGTTGVKKYNCFARYILKRFKQPLKKTLVKGVLIILWRPIIFCTYSNQLLTIRWLDFEGHIDVFNAAVDSS